MKAIDYPHIEIAPDGKPTITGTPTKVLDVVLDRIAYHWDAEEIHRQHPHLTLAQIYSALAYYHDHQAEMDQEIEKGLRDAEDIERRIGTSSLVQRLQALRSKP